MKTVMNGLIKKWNHFKEGRVYTYKLIRFRDKLIKINNHIVLIVFYFLVLTPISVFLRLSGKSFLRLKPIQKSYWKNHKIDRRLH